MSATATKRAKTGTLGEKVERYLRTLAAAKKGYKRADALLTEIVCEAHVDVPIKLSEQRSATLVDKMKDKIQVSTGAYFRRYEIEVTET